MEAYKSWVRRNRQLVSSFESVANTMTWFLPERFANSELTPETLSTLLGLVTVMNQHIAETAPRSQSRGVSHHVLGDEPAQIQLFPWCLCISVMKELEVLAEMAAGHYLGKDKKWGPVAFVEAIKAFLRLVILQKSGYRMLIDGGESRNVADPTGSPTPLQGPNRSRWQEGFVPKQSASQSRAIREIRSDGYYTRDLEGRALQAMQNFSKNMSGSSRPSWFGQRQSPQVEPRVQELHSCNLKPVSLQPKQCSTSRAFAAGMYLVASSSSLSRGSMGSHAPANMQQSCRISLSMCEVQELKRRQLCWALYAMRNPFFDRYTRRPLEMAEDILAPVPILGMLAGKVIELLLAVQGLYSYTAAS